MTTNGTVSPMMVESAAKMMFREPGESGAPGAPVTHDGAPSADPTPAAPPRRSWSLKRALLLGGIALVLAAAALLGPHYYRSLTSYESTDDAFVEGHVIAMSPKVGGNVLRVLVDDNQPVRAGDLVVEIDPRDYQARVAQARAALEIGRASCRERV